MAQPRYYARHDLALRRTAQAAGSGRLEASYPVELEDTAGTREQVATPFQLMGPGDVEGLAPGTVVRRHPAPAAGDAESGKIALVEFSRSDLPWRYTPVLPEGLRLRPWLVLVVGERGAQGVSVRPDGTVRIHPGVLQQHPLSQSHNWAHVHEVDGHIRSRLLGPATLQESTRYVAVLVPAFTAAGGPSWPDGATVAVSLPCYDSWQFATGLDGSFLKLASQLIRADSAELAARAGGLPFGKASLAYLNRATGEPTELQAAGALRAPARTVPDPADVKPPDTVAADVAALQQPVAGPADRPVITVPDYPRSFVDDGSAPAAGATWGKHSPDGWAAQLTEDPRLRGAAGLGAWTAIAWQDRIAEAAAERLGDVTIAAERIRALALGVAVSRSLWRRRVPEDPVRRLVVLAPSLGKIPVRAGGTVRQHLVGRTPQLTPALLSLAARRALRPGTARAALAEPEAHDLPGLLALAATCPDPTAADDALDTPVPAPEDLREAVTELLRAATEEEWLVEELLARRPDDEQYLSSWLAAVLRALAPGPEGRLDPDAVLELADRWEGHDFPDGSLATWDEVADEHAPACGRVDLVRLGEVVGAVVDPTVAEPPAAQRVYATLPGVRSMRPLEVDPELDLPLWSFLSTASPDWMLPGVGDLAEHEVVGVETNPVFVRALLVGANHQAASELRWRNVPLVPRSSPLRRFWQRARDTAGPAGSDTGLDIRPVRRWPVTAPLGDPTLAPAGLGSEAVVVIRSRIFLRYPGTVVYLYAAAPDWSPPPAGAALAAASRVEATFTGTIGPDVTFFGFPVPASALRSHWLVLEEPPPGYTFYPDKQASAGTGELHAGGYAKERFALPVRVLIGPLL